MESLKEVFRNSWAKLVIALKRFENSTLFEQIMRRYEALSPSEQNKVRQTLKIVSLLFFGFLVLGGPLMILSKVKKIKTLERLEAEAFIFQSEYEAKNKGYTPPSGWTPLSASTADDLTSSFNEYLMKIVIPEVYGTLIASGDKLNLTLREISIRQATKILFQLEALYPKLKATNFSARPNAQKSDILDINASFEFNSAAANQFAQGSKGSQNYPDDADFNSSAGPRGSGPGDSFSGGRGDENSMENPNVSGGYIPPSPSGESFDEFVPPEMPDDMPTPPGPPGFEGGVDSE